MAKGRTKDRGIIERPPVPHYLRDHVSESFNIFQASIAMIAILDGFLFSSLVQVLSRDQLTCWNRVSIWLMMLSLICNTGAMITMHTASHQVIHRCQFFYPKSRMIVAGRNLMDLAFIFLFATLGTMLFSHGMWALAVISLVFGFAIALFRRVSKRTPSSGQNIVQVD